MPDSSREYLDNVPRDVQDAIYDGQKIQAIKLAREAKGWGLKEAKEDVEGVERKLRERCPEGFARGASRAGCSTSVLALGLTIALACWLS